MLVKEDYCNSVLNLLQFTDSLRLVYIPLCVVNGIFSIIAVVCNSFIITAIIRRKALHTPSFVLLCTMAISDLGVGLIVQPLYIIRKLAELYNISHYYCPLSVAAHLSSSFFAALTFVTITALSVDRYLAVRLCIRYKITVTCRRAVIAAVLLICFAALYAATYVLSVHGFYVITVLILPLCLVIASFLYIKIYRMLRKQERRICTNTEASTVSSKQESRAGIAGYMKVVSTMVYISCIFLICYVPFFAASIALVIRGHRTYVLGAHHIAATIVFINSAINPVLYYWRMPEIRRAVRQILLLRN